MRTITFVTQKGGTGKSTLTANIAIAAEDAGLMVYVLDLDPQGSLKAWKKRRAKWADEGVDVDTVEPGRIKTALTALQQAGIDLVVIDTAGRDTPATAAAISASDLCLVPVRPSIVDLEASSATVQSILRLERPFAFVLNHCPPGRNIRITDAGRALSAMGHCAEPAIVTRHDYIDAMAHGMGVIEQNPDGKASTEIRELWTWIDNRTKPETQQVEAA
ncbi:ParA family protein [Aestuariivirga litoralis]|uniref:ParA family protein n=1 Tax=Aestuariivirga litoralis TaxID=2650924 RepID=UPI0018C71399|nr:ParA family protein [Aestuariivirga litoralis]MBG1233974.1 ParA family protein [Aestuariivirga litoralis]